MTNAPFGFQPIRTVDGGAIRTTQYRVAVSGNTHGIFIGDFVRLNPSGLGVIRVSGNAAPDTRVLGACTAVYDTNMKPMTHSQPTRGPFLPASTAGYVDVADSASITYIIQGDGSAAESIVGQFVTLTAASLGNTATGISVMQVRVASADTSTKFLQVVGVSPNEERGLGSVNNQDAWGNTSIDLEVRVALHNFLTS